MMGDIAKGIDPFSSPTKHRGCRNNVENDAVSIPGQFAGVVRFGCAMPSLGRVVVPGQFAGVVRGSQNHSVGRTVVIPRRIAGGGLRFMVQQPFNRDYHPRTNRQGIRARGWS